MVTILSLLGFLFIVAGGSLLILLSRDVHLLIAYSTFSLGVTLLSWPWYDFPIPLVFAVSGICSACILGFYILYRTSSAHLELSSLQFPAFRILFLFLAFSVSIILYEDIGILFHNPPLILLVPALFIILLGLFHLGLSELPFRVGINLIMITQGFSLVYFWVEPSLLVVGLFASVQLSLALVYSFLSFMQTPVFRETLS